MCQQNDSPFWMDLWTQYISTEVLPDTNFAPNLEDAFYKSFFEAYPLWDGNIVNKFTHAVKEGYDVVVGLYLEEGLDSSIGLGNAFIEACRQGHYRICLLLLEYGVDLNIFGFQGLLEAIMNDHPNIVKLLLDYGVDKNFANQYPLSLARELNRPAIISLLR